MMQALVFWIAVGFSCALGACVLVGLLCTTGAHLRTFWRCGWALVVAASVAIIHGGTKNITNRVTSDAGLSVVNAELVIPTNDVENAFLVLKWLGPDENQSLRVRDSVSEPWTWMGQEWLYDDRYYENGTNTATWWVDAPASNVVPHAHYHLGDDLPPVEIEGDGVEIIGLMDSSTNVIITYGVNAAALGGSVGTVRIEVQDRAGTEDVYHQSVSGGVTNTVTIPGFWIGRDTRWRVRLEVDQ